MTKTIELPLHLIASGRSVPVDLLDARGNLLMRKGSTITSEQHKEQLAAHGACVREADFKAWQRSYDRLINRMLRDGESLDAMAATPMPSVIEDSDYAVGFDIQGGWLDVHEVHKALLYQGPQAKSPLNRIESVHSRAAELLRSDADGALFTLFQALPDLSVSYGAKHALLAAVLVELTAHKLQLSELLRPVLFRAALLMNIGMARAQDEMARQTDKPSAEQLQLIEEHPARGVEILRGFGVIDEDLLDIVAWHHAPQRGSATASLVECKRIVHVADQFIAMMSTRATRDARSAPGAVKSLVLDASDDSARVGGAMTTAVGFYPPGTYLSLANGETAVSARRGASAHTPVVVSLLRADGLAMHQALARDTADKAFAARAPVAADRMKMTVNRRTIDAALARMATSVGA